MHPMSHLMRRDSGVVLEGRENRPGCIIGTQVHLVSKSKDYNMVSRVDLKDVRETGPFSFDQSTTQSKSVI